MSARGWRFTQGYGDALTYVETDLPAMADRKRAALSRMGSLGEHHRVIEADALSPSGRRAWQRLPASSIRRAGW